MSTLAFPLHLSFTYAFSFSSIVPDQLDDFSLACCLSLPFYGIKTGAVEFSKVVWNWKGKKF